MSAEQLDAPFAYDLRATRVVFASGAVPQLSSELTALGLSRAFVVTTPGRAASTASIRESLGDRLADWFDGAAEHVPTPVVAAALERFGRVDDAVVVAIGGGSAIGLGKAMARARGATLVAIPTTYSGSEMTSIWGETSDGVKRTGRDSRAAPRLVIYDPDLTIGLPPAISAASGMNAMAHAVEALYAANASPVALALAEESARLLARGLPRAVAQPSDEAARATTLAGAHLAGRALDLAAMGLHHRLCHVLGGTFGMPHARTHAALLPYVVAFNASAAPAAMQRLANALGAQDAVAGIAELRRTLGVNAPLAKLGLRDQDVDRAANEAAANAYANPRQASTADIHKILMAALRGDAPTDAASASAHAS
jgi:maleylacetate reductase